MNNHQYGIDYLVRIVTRLEGKPVISLNNILSINTQKSTSSDTGTFNIVLDYDQYFFQGRGVGGSVRFDALSDFFSIKPMDYVEIYAKHGDNRPFGVYSNKNNPQPDDVFPEDALNIIQRINNPHLLFCGFVDGITNSWSATGQGNSFTIAGKCLAKFLVQHHLFYEFPLSDLFAKDFATKNMMLSGKKPNEAIDALMVFGVMEVLEKDSKNLSSYSVTNDPDTKIDNAITIYHNRMPTFRYLYWATSRSSIINMINDESKDPSNTNSQYKGRLSSLDGLKMKNVNNPAELEKLGVFTWGRMEQQYTLTRAIMNISSDSTIMQIIRQSAGEPFNEFFVDELGNFVLRKFIDAIDYNTKDSSTDESIVRNWQVIDSSDILNFNFSLTDNELKTIVVNNPVGYIFGQSSSPVGVRGMCPATQDHLDAIFQIANTERAAFDKKQAKAGNQKSILQIIPDDPKAAYGKIKDQLVKGFDGFDLSSTTGINAFWKRFGMRPFVASDTVSNTVSESAENAYAIFQRYLTAWFAGSITVRGDSRFKIGQKLRIENFCLAKDRKTLLDMNCYVQSVSHSIQFGGLWTTTLNFTNAKIDGVIG
jgi:hypothetical protein